MNNIDLNQACSMLVTSQKQLKSCKLFIQPIPTGSSYLMFIYTEEKTTRSFSQNLQQRRTNGSGWRLHLEVSCQCRGNIIGCDRAVYFCRL